MGQALVLLRLASVYPIASIKLQNLTRLQRKRTPGFRRLSGASTEVRRNQNTEASFTCISILAFGKICRAASVSEVQPSCQWT